MKCTHQHLLCLSLFIFVAHVGCSTKTNTETTQEHTHPATALVLEKLQSLNSMREGLAASIDPALPITPETFKTTCMPVGMEYKRWADEKGYKARQVSDKNRNPLNAPSDLESPIIEEFKTNAALVHKIVPATDGVFIYHKIRATSQCLHCHGAKDTRPDFIKNKYPEDKAYDYKAGDFRGVYSVFIPQVTSQK